MRDISVLGVRNNPGISARMSIKFITKKEDRMDSRHLLVYALQHKLSKEGLRIRLEYPNGTVYEFPDHFAAFNHLVNQKQAFPDSLPDEFYKLALARLGEMPSGIDRSDYE